jgi:hypothetical protein
MSDIFEQVEAARRTMLLSQQELADYEKHAALSSPDPQRFEDLFAKLQHSTREYLKLVKQHFRERYKLPPKKSSLTSDAISPGLNSD